MKINEILRVTTGIALAMTVGLGATPLLAQADPSASRTVSQSDAAPVPVSRAEAKRLAREARAEAKRRARAEKLARKQAKIDTGTGTGNDIVVNGVKKSLTSSRNAKRKAAQITETVTAEDLSKLPDNNVPEALQRLAGVVIDRTHGEGDSVIIRGLTDVQTTINGNEVGSSGGRNANLADIPSELLKSVTVYKTRTANQIEGGLGGTVNVELRRPLDLKKGWTVAGSFRDVFVNVGGTWSPYGSILAAYRFDTGIGEMGFLVNASFEQNRYFEPYVFSESPQLAPGPDPSVGYLGSVGYLSLPANVRNTLSIPYRVNYGVDNGEIKRPSINVAYQWRPSSKLDFVLEGTYIGAFANAYSNHMSIITNDGGSTYSNLVLTPNNSIKSVTLTNPAGIAGGPESFFSDNKSRNFNTNFETHWRGDKVQINATAQYNVATSSYRQVNIVERLVGATTANVDFVSRGAPTVTFPGIDLSNPTNYGISAVHDQYGNDRNSLFVGQLDLTINTSSTAFFRSLQFGARGTYRKDASHYGYRDAGFPDQANDPLLTQFPAALETTSPNIPGAVTATWFHPDAKQFLANFSQVRQVLKAQNAVVYDGGTLDTELPAAASGAEFRFHEYTIAEYGQFNYGFKAIFPIDGVIGARIINTWGGSTSTQFATKYTTDANGNQICCQVIATPASAKGNYVDILPSFNTVIHFAPKLQGRLAYTHNVSRPDFGALSPTISYDATQINNPLSVVSSGNPNLKPVTENSYDATLEWYFGHAGQLSVSGFVKKQNGFIYPTTRLERVPQLGNTLHYVSELRNAGNGEIDGIEFSGQTFFDFFPGLWKNFGINANFTWILHNKFVYSDIGLSDSDKVNFSKIPGYYESPYTAKYVYNIQVYYETPKFGARVAWNYRSSYKDVSDLFVPLYQLYDKSLGRLDASLDYTPYKFLTLTLDGTNLLQGRAQQYYGVIAALPVGVRLESSTVQLGARFRF